MEGFRVIPDGKYDFGKTPYADETSRKFQRHALFKSGFTVTDDTT